MGTEHIFHFNTAISDNVPPWLQTKARPDEGTGENIMFQDDSKRFVLVGIGV